MEASSPYFDTQLSRLDVYNILDGAIVYLLVAVANGLIDPRLFGDQQAS